MKSSISLSMSNNNMLSGLGKGKFYFWFLFLVLSVLLIFWSAIFDPSDYKYFTFVYVVVGFVLIMFRTPLILVKRAWICYFFIFDNILFLFVYFTDDSSLINIIALLVSYLAIYYLVAAGMKYQGDESFINNIFKILQYILLLSLFISPILTYFRFPNAPDYYPWEAVFSENRFLLITGNGVGHSNAMWLMALISCYFLKILFDKKNTSNKILIFILIPILIIGLIETKSRTALLFIAILGLTIAGYLRILSRRILAVIPIIGVIVFFVSIFNPSYQYKIEDSLSSLQAVFPSLRILQSDQSNISLYSGREILNIALVTEFGEHPWFGAGHGAPVLLYGVNSEGNVVSFDERKYAESESTLRVLTKYGIIYFAGLIAFLFTPLFRAFKGEYQDNIFVISVCSLILASSINGSIFENIYGISGLFAVLIITFLITPKYSPDHIEQENLNTGLLAKLG